MIAAYRTNTKKKKKKSGKHTKSHGSREKTIRNKQTDHVLGKGYFQDGQPTAMTDGQNIGLDLQQGRAQALGE